MRIPTLSLIALIGCHNVGGLELIETGDPDEGDTDTDTDTDADTDADTDVFQPGAYAGDMNGTYEDGHREMSCSGVVELQVGSDGSVSGGGTCTWEAGGWAWEGDITGSVSETAFTGVWSVDSGGWEPMDFDFTGTVAAGTFEATMHDESEWGTTDIAIEAYLLD